MTQTSVKRILIVEDEENITILLTFLLEQSGYTVDSVTEGELALGQVISNTPDVLILDVMLPGIDGFEVLRQVRQDARVGDLPILMLTAKGQKEDQEYALTLGANKYITKPFSNTDLVAAVNQLAKS